MRDLLASGKWKEADEETANKMVEVAGITEDGWLEFEDIDDRFPPCQQDLHTIYQSPSHNRRIDNGELRVEDIDRFPCEDLRTIDQLWVKYSNGRFGFSVQKRIYESLGGTRENDYKIWEAFGDRVGWRVNSSKWLHYNDLKFNTKAPIGHLPCVKGKLTDGVVGGGLVVGRSLLSRRDLQGVTSKGYRVS